MTSILVVDDDHAVRDLLATALADLGEVRTVPDGPAALEATATDVPDVAVLDVMMPGMDGLEVLRRWREDERTADIGVVMLTARDEQPIEETAYEIGAEAFLAKPFDVGVLEMLVTTILTERASAQRDALSELRGLDRS